MQVVLLTTATSHHLYYAWQMRRAGVLDAIVVETQRPRFPFATEHPFEQERDRYETTTLLQGAPNALEEIAPVFRCVTANTPDAMAELQRLRPEVIIIFGTGRISNEVAGLATTACLNLHGGNPEAYRGLDTHLWAIYHRDFENLVTTLHFVAPELDAGEIVFSAKLPVPRGAALHQLRAINTQVCVDLSLQAMRLLVLGQPLPCRRQQSPGRYYSAMPSVLKNGCMTKFARYTAGL
jgi:methionyl-tRNA formyltransferase